MKLFKSLLVAAAVQPANAWWYMKYSNADCTNNPETGLLGGLANLGSAKSLNEVTAMNTCTSTAGGDPSTLNHRNVKMLTCVTGGAVTFEDYSWADSLCSGTATNITTTDGGCNTDNTDYYSICCAAACAGSDASRVIGGLGAAAVALAVTLF